jgi:hypothetical protein
VPRGRETEPFKKVDQFLCRQNFGDYVNCAIVLTDDNGVGEDWGNMFCIVRIEFFSHGGRKVKSRNE